MTPATKDIRANGRQTGTLQGRSSLDALASTWERFASHVGETSWRGRQQLDSVRLAFYEALTNLIKHAHHQDGRPFELEWSATDDCLAVVFVDSGQAYEIPEVGDLGDQVWATSGRGWDLIHLLTASRSVERSEGRNRLRLSFVA